MTSEHGDGGQWVLYQRQAGQWRELSRYDREEDAQLDAAFFWRRDGLAVSAAAAGTNPTDGELLNAVEHPARAHAIAALHQYREHLAKKEMHFWYLLNAISGETARLFSDTLAHDQSVSIVALDALITVAGMETSYPWRYEVDLRDVFGNAAHRAAVVRDAIAWLEGGEEKLVTPDAIQS